MLFPLFVIDNDQVLEKNIYVWNKYIELFYLSDKCDTDWLNVKNESWGKCIVCVIRYTIH